MYVKGVNDALSKHSELKDTDLVSLLKNVGTDKVPSDIATPVRNHGAPAAGRTNAPEDASRHV